MNNLNLSALLLWVLLNMLILVSLDLLVYSKKYKGSRRFVSTFVLFLAQIVSSEFLLGVTKNLTRKNLFIMNILLCSVLLSYTFWRNGKKIIINYILDYKKHIRLKNWVMAIKNDPLFSIVAFLSIVTLAWIIFLGVIFPVVDWDGNAYHMTYIGNAIQNKHIFDSPSSIPWLIGYPKGGEFIQMWSVLGIRNDILVDLTQLPFLLLAVVALYNLSLSIGVSKKNARFTSLMFLFTPVLINQLKTTYVDVMLCSLFFGALYLSVKEKLANFDLFVIGIIFSLLISIKSTGSLFIVAILLFLIWNIYINLPKKSRLNFRKYLRPILIAAAAMPFGLYWYAKNYILYKSPFYPFGLKALGKPIFPGKTYEEYLSNYMYGLEKMPKTCLERIWFSWTEQTNWAKCLYIYDSPYAGLGPIWFITMLPAFIVAIYIAIKQKNWLFLAISAACLVVFAAYPFNFYSRYVLFLPLIGILSLGLVLNNIKPIIANIVKIISIILILLVMLTNLTMCYFSTERIRSQLDSLRHGSTRGSIYDSIPGRAFVFMQEEASNGDVIAYDSKPYFIYPLWKPDYSNKVVYVPVGDNELGWMESLEKQNVKYVFTFIDSPENKLARKSSLRLIYRDESYEIYKIK